MNRKAHFLALTTALALILSGVHAAAQASSTSMPFDPETRAKIQQNLQYLNKELSLTEDQRQKLQPIVQSEYQQIKLIRDDTSLTSDQKQAKEQAIRDNTKADIAPLLTPDQQRKFATMKEDKKD
jgi:Spy/CpxP family protein refolding chaperone